MRKIVLLSLCAFALASPALADQTDGKVAFVDRAGKAFNVGTAPTIQLSSPAFKATPQTIYMMGAAPTSFDAVKVGVPVRVNYHVVGSDAIADQILIQQ